MVNDRGKVALLFKIEKIREKQNMLKLLILKDLYLNNTQGATAIEYGLIAAGISLGIVAVVFTFGDQLETTFTTMTTSMTNANAEIVTNN